MNAASDGSQQALGDLSNTANIHKATYKSSNHSRYGCKHIFICENKSKYASIRVPAMKPLGVGCSIMVNMWHFAEWLLWLRVHPFNCREVGPGLRLPRSHCRPWQFHHQLTFLWSQIILNWEAFKMPLILIMSRSNMTVTVVWESGSQIWKIDES